MTSEQATAYINAMSVAALIEMNGMIAANQERQRHDQASAYGEKAFNDLILRYGISHNQIIDFFRRFE